VDTPIPTPRQFRPVRETLGAWVRGKRPEDEELRKRTAHVSKGFMKWLGGGGFAIYFALRAMSLGERWLERTWQQTDALTEKVGKVGEALEKGADAQEKLITRIDLLLGKRVEESPAQQPQNLRKSVKVAPVGPSR